MASTFKVLARRFGTTAPATVYTVPASTKTLITNIVVANNNASAATFTIGLYNNSTATEVPLATTTNVPAKDSVIIDAKTLLDTSDQIRITASINSAISFHITGLELT
jgi:hypothetical protein